MISVNATLFVQVALFLLLVFILNRIMVRPIHKLISDREQDLSQKRGELLSLHAELEKLAKEYQKSLKQAEQQAIEAQAAMTHAADRDAHTMLSGAQEQGQALRQRIRQEVQEELIKARKKLMEQAEALSFDVTHKVIGRHL